MGFRSYSNLRRFCLKKASKIVFVFFIFLIIAAVPLYYYTRPETTQTDVLQIKGKVNNPTTLTLSQLKTQPSTTVQVTLSSSSRPSDNGVYNYTGVQLPELLAQAIILDKCHLRIHSSFRRLRNDHKYPRCNEPKHYHSLPKKRLTLDSAKR